MDREKVFWCDQFVLLVNVGSCEILWEKKTLFTQ